MRPSRIALTSVPSSTTPASNCSRYSKSNPALRLSASRRGVLSAGLGGGDFGCEVWWVDMRGRGPLPGDHVCPPEPGREDDRADHARGVGGTLPGDVERGAVIHRRPDDRESERDID